METSAASTAGQQIGHVLVCELQVEFLLSRVMLLKESIDDTEDLINIELDQR